MSEFFWTNSSTSSVIYLISSYAYLLVFHGSRDSRTQAAASKLKQLSIAKFQSKNILTQHNYLSTTLPNLNSNNTAISNLAETPWIEIAALELSPISLRESIIDFARQARRRGFEQIKVIPLFLAPGVHVTEDLPEEVALAIKQLDFPMTIELSRYLGKYSGMIPLLLDKFGELPAQKRILIAHGSRKSSVTNYYQNLAGKLDAEVAYWSKEPKFTRQIELQIASGMRKIAILPYFLFPGKITAAIAREVAQLRQEYPQVELNLGQPLGATEALAELIVREG